MLPGTSILFDMLYDHGEYATPGGVETWSGTVYLKCRFRACLKWLWAEYSSIKSWWWFVYCVFNNNIYMAFFVSYLRIMGNRICVICNNYILFMTVQYYIRFDGRKFYALSYGDIDFTWLIFHIRGKLRVKLRLIRLSFFFNTIFFEGHIMNWLCYNAI